MTDLTNDQLVAFAEMLADYKTPTWPHVNCEPCVPDTLNLMKIQHASTYNPIRCEKYTSDIAPNRVCCDSAGMLKAFFWSHGGQNIRTFLAGGQQHRLQWQAYGFPDLDAKQINKLFRALEPSRYGTNMSNMPDVPGVILFRKNTLGIYVGDGYAVTAIKFPGTVAKLSLAHNEWESWSYVPFRFMRYTEKPKKEATPCLQLHSADEKVADVKEMLTKLGYFDGRHGSTNVLFDRETQAAVMAFEEDHGREPTGMIDIRFMSELEQEYADSL